MSRKYIVTFGVALAIVVLSLFLPGPFNRLEDQLLDVRYTIRGEVPADTNVVILYFDNDDIASLGGWPLTRNYYALLINVLTSSGVSAIGLDIFFGEHNLQFPEHDYLLASVTSGSGRVVLSSYFRQLTSKPGESSNPQNSANAYLTAPSMGDYGNHLQLPFHELAEAAAGIGHANLIEGSVDAIPMYIRTNDHAVPSFAVELLRVYYGMSRDQVKLNSDEVTFTSPAGTRSISFDRHGHAFLNFPGGISSFKRFRSVEVLRSYELQKLGAASTIDFSALKNKIVLIGVIGEGRSIFVPSPFDPLFASVGVHATIVDNALQQRFLAKLNWIGSLILSMILVLLASIPIARFGYLRGIGATFVIGVVYVVVNQLFFTNLNIVLPIAQPIVLLAMVSLGAVVYEYLIVRKRVGELESNKERIEGELRERELKLQVLEQELFDQKSKDGATSGAKLLEEIKRYKQDIKTLSARMSDLVKFEAPEPEPGGEEAVFEDIVYQSSGKMKEVVDLVRKIATSDANVLILGESGTGKELVAQAIHRLSNRSARQFVAVNCGALTETLLESELFGHEKGSFTGAVKDKVGRFEFADGGTIFLDEIAETSEAFQVKLLRVVQSGEFERVGSTTTKKTDARIVAATNKNLKDLMQEKRFREDLYYRLNVFSVQLPSLRERKGDIPILAEFFVKREENSLALSSTVVDAFLQYHWPGNVRQLESIIKRAAILAKSEQRTLIQLKDISEEIVAALKGQVDLEDQILELLRSKKFSRSSISETAEELGDLNRGTVAEYFRGICFKYFFESVWDKEQAIQGIAGGTNGEVNGKVEKKLSEYLTNVVDGMQVGSAFEEIKPALKSKYKNLPQRYHTILDEVIRAYLTGKWS